MLALAFRPPDSCLSRIAEASGVSVAAVSAVARDLADGYAVPFIARFRKDRTGGLDADAILRVREELDDAMRLHDRREAIIRSLKRRGHWTPELEADLAIASTRAELEDLSARFAPRRRSRANAARERGLEPLADFLFANQDDPSVDPADRARQFVRLQAPPKRRVADEADALSGARAILAERFADDPDVRLQTRDLLWNDGLCTAIAAKGAAADSPEAADYREFFEWTEPIASIPPERLLAILRGESEGILELGFAFPVKDALRRLRRRFVTGRGPCAEQIAAAVDEALSRHLAPSLEADFRAEAKSRADAAAIRKLSADLRGILMTPPLGPKRVLAINPGRNPGCSIAVLDRDGALLDHALLPLLGPSENDVARAKAELRRLARRFEVEAVAVGDGTGGAEARAAADAAGLPPGVPLTTVPAVGASTFAVSPAARAEFAECDTGVRGAVSLGRRLQDPLAELTRIEPKALAAGPHRGDLDPQRLEAALEDTIRRCVAEVGVDLNAAPESLLAWVPGLGPSQARSIVEHRSARGVFRDRRELLDVPGIGPLEFDNAAGFVRIPRGRHPLDATGIHPTHYPIVERMARDLGCEIRDLRKSSPLRSQVRPDRYAVNGAGPLTIADLLAELASPGRDPRGDRPPGTDAERPGKPRTFRPGTVLPAVVSEISPDGIIVDLGPGIAGRVPPEEIPDQPQDDAPERLAVGARTQVRVLRVDDETRAPVLSMRRPAPAAPTPSRTRDRRNLLQRRYGAAPEPIADPAAGDEAAGRSGPSPFSLAEAPPATSPPQQRPALRIPTAAPRFADSGARVVDRLTQWREARGLEPDPTGGDAEAEQHKEVEEDSAADANRAVPAPRSGAPPATGGDARVTDRLEEWRRQRLAAQSGDGSDDADGDGSRGRSWLARALRKARIGS